MKRIRLFLSTCLSAILLLNSLNISDYAVTEEECDIAVSSLDQIYADAYENCLTSSDLSIDDDYGAYSYLLHNLESLNIEELVVISDDLCDSISEEESNYIIDFIKRINTLLDLGAIQVTDNFEICTKEAPSAADTPIVAIATFDVMGVCRANAAELKSVYDNAVFGTAHIVAGVYFTERVKSDGAWDFKQILGKDTLYYEGELGTLMSGETIGNFHYGYVGSTCFGETTLKTAAGLYQLWSGTSSIDYWTTYFDEPEDQYDIQWGINVYNSEN